MIDAKLADNNVNNRELFWRSLPGVAVNIDCGGYDKLVYTNETHELFRWNDQIEKFELVCGGVKDAAIGSDGDLWKVTTTGSIFRLEALSEKSGNHKWKQIPFPKAVGISASDRRHVAILDKRGHIFEMVDEDAEDHFNAWTHVHLPGNKNNFVEVLSFSVDGVMWAIDHSHQLWMRSSGVGWTPMNMPCVSVSGASHNRTFVVSEMPEGVVYRHKGYTDFSRTHGFDLEGSSPTFIAISLGQDGTLFGLTSNYSLVIDLPPEVRRIQAKEKYKLLMEMDKEKPKHNELNNNNMMITDESRGKSHTLSTSRLTYSDGKLKEMKRISEKSDPNALIEEARALLHKAKESGANLKGRKRKTKDDEYDNGYYSDASYDSLDSRDFNDGEGPCFTCGHDPSNDTFRWDTIPEEFRQRKTSTRTFMHQEEIKDTPTLLPLPIFELDQTLQLEEEGLNRLIAYIDKDSLFRRYLWPLLLACTYVIVVLSAIISTINWSTCSLLSEPMAVLSGSLFLSALFISALHDQSEGKHGRGGITWFWIVQGVCLLLVNLIIYAYDVVLTINLFSRNSQNCDTRNTSYHWLMSMAMITLICSFLLALFFTLLAILVLFHRSHMQIPDPSPFWRYKFHTTTQTASVPELTQQRTWMNKIQFFNAFARMEAHDSLGGNYILTKSLIQMLVYSKTDLLMETMDIVFDSLKLPEPPLKLEDAALLVADDSLATKKKKKKKEEDAMSWFDYLSSHYRDEVAKPAQWKPGLKSLRGLENDIDRREFKRRIKVLYEAQIRTEVSFFLNSDSSKKEATRDDKRLKWKESFNASRPPGIPALIYWGSSRTEDVLIPTLFFPASFYSERSPTIVFSHGHNTDMGDWLEWLRTARDYLRFFNVMTYEYPGYGMLCKSEVSKARCFAALDSCMSVLNRVYKVPVDNTVLMGFDMGAGLSISYAAHLSEHRLHLAGVAILAATCSAFVGFLGGAVDWDVPVNFDELVEVSCPVFVGHGERDRVTSPRHSLAIAKELRLRTGALTRLNIIKSAGHGLKPLYFYSDLIEFLKNDINQNGRNIFYDDDPDDSPEEWQTHLPSNCPSPVRNDAEADLAYENQWGKHTDLEAGEKQNLIR